MKSRMINTDFWIDNYTSNLDPSEKLLFLYMLTNTHTSICGIYQIPLKEIALQTGFDKEMVIKILNRFENDGKMIYRNGWVAIKNFIKNQNQKSPKIQKGIEEQIKIVPDELKEYIKGIYTLSHLNSNSNSNSNSKLKYMDHVYLTEEEYTVLITEYHQNDVEPKIAYLNCELANNNIKYIYEESHYSVLIKWLVNDVCAGRIKKKPKPTLCPDCLALGIKTDITGRQYCPACDTRKADEDWKNSHKDAV